MSKNLRKPEQPVGPLIKRLVDLVDRGPQDDHFFPANARETLFRREWPTYHNVVPEVVEIGYQGNAAWGQRITIPIKREETGDLLSWMCLRLKPRTWLGPDLESKLLSGDWDYQDPSGAWMWASSLGSIAIAKVELEINDTLIESWDGNWMDVWSRQWMDGGRAAVWDSDIYGQLPSWELHDTTRPPWTTVLPTEDGYVYCWLPLAFLRRPRTAFPLLALGPQTEMRVHITLAKFTDVVRRRAVVRTSACETPIGSSLVVLDKTGPTAIPYEFPMMTTVPAFEDTTVFCGVIQTEGGYRENLMRVPMELMYDRVVHTRYEVDPTLAQNNEITMRIPLTDLNGPIRELCWVIRRKGVWKYNEWTNYGRLLEDELLASVPDDEDGRPIHVQLPIMIKARLLVGNAVWRDESEEWWRLEYGLAHRGGVRVAAGMVYGFVLGDGAGWTAEDLQPAGTVNASRADMKLELTLLPYENDEYEVHVFGIGVNWLRFAHGQAVPLFTD